MTKGRRWLLLVPGLLLAVLCAMELQASGEDGTATTFPTGTGMATLRVYLSDRPNPAVRTGSFTLADSALHRPGGGWYGLQRENLVFEFSAVAGEELLIGEIQVPPGRYDRLRLLLAAAAVEIGGAFRPVAAPADELQLERELELCAGETEVVIELGARWSLRAPDTSASYRVQPVLRIADLTSACSAGGDGILALGDVGPVRPL